jgi:Zn finger protein HypA/HybF involved in hydrogenase expression
MPTKRKYFEDKHCIDCNIILDKDYYALRCPTCKEIHNKIKSKKQRLKHPYKRTLDSCFLGYKHGALKRNLEFELTKEDFKELWNKSCYYCGDTIETIGIDRRDNNKGYVSNNIVPCCPTCNYMKHKLDEETFLQKCIKIALWSSLQHSK